MKTNKNTVVVYADWRNIFIKLNDQEAGKLIKHFFDYISNLDPSPPDRMTELLFEPIKISLERDMNSKVKEKNSTENKSKFTPPDLDSVKQYFKECGYKEDIAIKAFNYYNVADWHDSKGNKLKNWKQKMQAVWFKDENKVDYGFKSAFENFK